MITLGGKYRRLDKLTRMMTRANDAYRATGREDRARRARIARVQLRLSNARATEVTRLHATGFTGLFAWWRAHWRAATLNHALEPRGRR